MSQFIDLANKSSIVDILSTPTEEKSPSESVFETVEAIIKPDGPSSPSPESTASPEIEESEDTKLSAQESAEALVAMMEGIVAPIFTGLHYRKFKKQFTDEQKKIIDLAEGKPVEDRTDEEKAHIGRFERLERDMKERIKDVTFTDEEYNRLIKPGALMCKKHGLDIPPGLAFALVGAQVISNRVIDLIAG